MATDVTTLSAKEVIKQYKEKPDIEFKLKYYEEVIAANEEIIRGLSDKKNYDFTKYGISFFTLKVKKYLGRPELAQIKIQLLEMKERLYMNKKYLKQWEGRMANWQGRFEEMVKETNEYFDCIIDRAKTELKDNKKVYDIIIGYTNPENVVETKVDFYYFVKNELEKVIRARQGRFDIKFIKEAYENRKA